MSRPALHFPQGSAAQFQLPVSFFVRLNQQNRRVARVKVHCGDNVVAFHEEHLPSAVLLAAAHDVAVADRVVIRGGQAGHVQRGGNPTVRDRVVATQMGFAAVELLREGKGNRVIGMQKGEIVDFDIYEALNMKKPFDDDMYEIAHITSI